ncbi:hypothetical protein V6N12_050237 [Hibiscus sabdariffa]|uniref:Uncharacterized protein n=1 Tax=Hibiscus sabdariffa TaxID=183260 RepID=A0ABR2GBS9_9ROSI
MEWLELGFGYRCGSTGVGSDDERLKKANEGKDTTIGKLGELKDFANRAMDFLIGKMKETKQKTSKTAKNTKSYSDATRREGREGCMETIVVKVEESLVGTIDATLKSSDRTFNDVGRVDEHGVICDSSSKPKM